MTENKLSNAVTRIKMPEETQQKILKKCSEYQSSDVTDNEYSQHVSGVEMAKNIHFRKLSSVAAVLALTAGGIGLTVHIARNSPKDTNHFASSDVELTEEIIITDSIDSTKPTTVEDILDPTENPSGISLFIDFEELFTSGRTIKYTLGDKPMDDLTAHECRLLDEFFTLAIENGELTADVSSSYVLPMPTMTFVSDNGTEKPACLYIYHDDCLYVRDDSGAEAIYRYNSGRLAAAVETVFRNGSVADDDACYPPFGNFAKMSDKPYHAILGVDGEETIEREIDGKTLHHAFYGYNWAACETDMRVESSGMVIRITIEKPDGYETVAIDENGFVTWYLNSDHSVKCYQLPDNLAFSEELYPIFFDN